MTQGLCSYNFSRKKVETRPLGLSGQLDQKISELKVQ